MTDYQDPRHVPTLLALEAMHAEGVTDVTAEPTGPLHASKLRAAFAAKLVDRRDVFRLGRYTTGWRLTNRGHIALSYARRQRAAAKEQGT